jgi:hypothetical protein
MFASVIFEELAAFRDQELLLFGTAAFVSELSEATITRQQVNVSRIVDLPVWSSELFGWAGGAAVEKVARPENLAPLPGFGISVGDEGIVAACGQLVASSRNQVRSGSASMNSAVR